MKPIIVFTSTLLLSVYLGAADYKVKSTDELLNMQGNQKTTKACNAIRDELTSREAAMTPEQRKRHHDYLAKKKREKEQRRKSAE